MIPEILVEEDIKRWIKEDINYWDVTSNLLPDKKAKAKVLSKQEGYVAGLPFIAKVFLLLGADKIDIKVEEGEFVKKKTILLTVSGDISILLQAERIALNILGRLSGIATETKKLLEKARKKNPALRVCGTRKTVPGLSKYDKYAISVGGGDTHRFNLSSMVLLKENHLTSFKSVSEAIQYSKKKTSFSQKIEIEVQTEEQAIEATRSDADIIMLDNFTPVQAKLTIPKIKKINKGVLIELSGNINFDNIENYSLDSVDLISSGSLTHSVKNFDVTMLIE